MEETFEILINELMADEEFRIRSSAIHEGRSTSPATGVFRCARARFTR